MNGGATGPSAPTSSTCACAPTITLQLPPNPSSEPSWLLWEWAKAAPTALIPALIASAVGWVAYNQYRVARAKLNLDLFERRARLFAILNEALSARGEVESNAGYPEDQHVKVLDPVRLLAESREEFHFLFGNEIAELVGATIKNSYRARAIERSLAQVRTPTETRALETKERIELNEWFDRERRGLLDRFTRYLGFSNWAAR